MTALSILLPTYNGGRYLREQVGSIVAQTFADWELLICDDGSSDDTVAVAADLARADPRIRLLPSAGNRGQKRRLRELFAHAASGLIAVSDQDDMWVPEKLALLVAALGEADLSFGASRLTDADGRDLGRDLLDSLPPRYVPGERLSLLFRPAVSAHAMVARRALFEGVSFDRIAPFDWLMSLEAAFAGGIAYVPAARTLHRMHDANQMNGGFAATRARSRLVSRYELRNLPRWVAAQRSALLANLEHLAFAATLSADRNRAFAQAHRLCRDTWSEAPLQARLSTARLLAELETVLRPLAASDRDWRFAEANLRLACRSPWHPARLSDRLRRHRLEA